MTDMTPERLAEWEGDPTRWPHTPPLDVWTVLADRDSSLVWRVSTGHIVNLLETAVAALEAQTAEVEQMSMPVEVEWDGRWRTLAQSEADARKVLMRDTKAGLIDRYIRQWQSDLQGSEFVVSMLTHRADAAERERDEARAEASKIEGRAVEWSKRAETAEAAAKYATGRMIDARALLQQMADRIDPFVFDELASELDDQPLDANGDTFEHRLNRAEAALERVRALHPRKEFDDSPGEFYCDACQRTAGLWPCPTVQAIEGADDE